MRTQIQRRLLPIGVVSVVTLALIGSSANAASMPRGSHNRPHATQQQNAPFLRSNVLGGPPGNPDGGVDDPTSADQQYFQARSAPGIVAPGAYGAAIAQLKSMDDVGGHWQQVTNKPYNSDDPIYRDYDSNSSAGSGNVTGRITGLAADNEGHVYAGAANGGVWRSSVGGGNWKPISDKLPAQSTGDLELDAHGKLWYATGEANTAGDTFTGSGVYVLRDPAHGTFSAHDRVGGSELESTSIRKLRIIGDTAWAATTRGVWTHSASNLSGPWKLAFAPNPAYLPGGALAADPTAIYKNIANDIAADPKDPSKVVLAIGWRSGDTYNGFYTRQGGVWTRITSSLGDLPTAAANVGAVTFARSADGSKYYAINQDPTLITSPKSTLGGIYVSTSGSPFGPWTLVAGSAKLEASGSAETGATYNPGVQAWYNQFLQVDPNDPSHLYAGLEEVYETHDAGATWQTVGPYWNFTFACWSIDPTEQSGTCPQTTHSDQHAVAIGSYHGKSFVYVGNDGGAYKRPVKGSVDALGHATDWQSLNDGTINVLQYYSVGVGKDTKSGGFDVSGGLQDNGQSILRPSEPVMGSNFGGDGGDTLVDPANGCNIAEEYTNLAMWVTNDCGANVSTDPSTATEYSVPPNDGVTGNARFIAPFTADAKNPNVWVAGGEHVAVQSKGYAIRSTSDWTDVYDLGAGNVATAVAASGGTIYAAWCGGSCNGPGFTRGIAVGKADGTGWHQLNLPVNGTVPNRYLAGLEIDPHNSNHVYVAVNGFSRKWTEGPGAGVGHIFESWNGGVTWCDISANLPDVPANSVRVLPDGSLVLATDLAVFYRGAHSAQWKILGENLPTNATLQVKIGPDGKIYAATHGRGIWSLAIPRGHGGY